MSDQCPHGRDRGGTQLSGVWAGGVGDCRCCEQSFGVCNSATIRDGIAVWSSTRDATLCKSCGGVSTEYTHPDYEKVRTGEHTVELRKKERP